MIVSMDVLTDLLARARARGALFAHTTLPAPWGLAFDGETALGFHAVLHGEAWLRRDDAPDTPDAGWLHLGPGDVALVRRPSAHRLVARPGDAVVALADVVDAWRVGERRFRGPGDGDETAVLCGAYGFDGSVCDSLLDSLPPVVHLRRPGGELRAVLDLVSGEVDRPGPGAQTLLDRLLDVVLVLALRDHASAGAPLVRALRDAEVGRALELLHAEPARAWTVAALAAEVGLSRAALARRFAALVGEPPLGYLTTLRMGLAEERLSGTDAKLATVAAAVGYGSEFAFSAAFKRRHGVAPGAWRTAERARTAAAA